MAYVVKILPRAERDLRNIYREIEARTSDAALAWYLGLRAAIRSLRNSPNRCPVTPEDCDLRHLLYGNKPHIYRVIYRVAETRKQVDILHIRHGARQSINPSDLPRRFRW